MPIVHNLEEKWGNTKVNVPHTNTLDHTHCSLSHNVYCCMPFFSVSVCVAKCVVWCELCTARLHHVTILLEHVQLKLVLSRSVPI